jgi:hypothetical protein
MFSILASPCWSYRMGYDHICIRWFWALQSKDVNSATVPKVYPVIYLTIVLNQCMQVLK